MDFYLWASARCAVKEYCHAEIEAKLKNKGTTPEETESIIQKLENEGFINENRYAEAFAADKFRFDHWGRTKIRYALRNKGITESIVNQAIDKCIDPEAYHMALKDFIAAKTRQTKAPDAYTLRQKVARAAIARGFEPHLVFELLSLDN